MKAQGRWAREAGGEPEAAVLRAPEGRGSSPGGDPRRQGEGRSGGPWGPPRCFVYLSVVKG